MRLESIHLDFTIEVDKRDMDIFDSSAPLLSNEVIKNT